MMAMLMLKRIAKPGELPYLVNPMVNESFACGYHLIGDFDKEGGHPLRGVVVLGDAVDHADSIHQAWNVFNHGCLRKG